MDTVTNAKLVHESASTPGSSCLGAAVNIQSGSDMYLTAIDIGFIGVVF
jgi:hypothetical protein